MACTSTCGCLETRAPTAIHHLLSQSQSSKGPGLTFPRNQWFNKETRWGCKQWLCTIELEAGRLICPLPPGSVRACRWNFPAWALATFLYVKAWAHNAPLALGADGLQGLMISAPRHSAPAASCASRAPCASIKVRGQARRVGHHDAPGPPVSGGHRISGAAVVALGLARHRQASSARAGRAAFCSARDSPIFCSAVSTATDWRAAVAELIAEANYQLRSRSNHHWDFCLVHVSGHESASVVDITMTLDRNLGTDGACLGAAVNGCGGPGTDHKRIHGSGSPVIQMAAVKLPTRFGRGQRDDHDKQAHKATAAQDLFQQHPGCLAGESKGGWLSFEPWWFEFK